MGKSLTKNSVFYLIYNVLNILFPFLTGIYVARILLPDTVGAVESARNIAQYFVILAFLGIPTYGMREIAKVRDEKESLNKLYSELFFINLISTCFFFAAYSGLVLAVPEYRANATLYFIVGIAIALNAVNNSWLFEGLEEFKFISLRNVAFKVLSFVLLVIFVRGSEDIFIYAAITVVGTAGNYLLNIFFTRKFARLTVRGLSFRRHLKPIGILVVVNLAIELYSLVDVTMLGIFCENENVAFYSYAVKIQKIFMQVVNTFTMVLVPRISYAYKNGEFEQVNDLLSKTLKVIVLLAVPIVVGVFFVADFIVVLLYGAEYIRSAAILKILSIILTLSPVGYLLGSRVLLISGNENKMPVAVGIGALVNIVGNAVLIPLMQEAGAAIASVIGEVAVMTVYLLLGKKYYSLKGIFSTCWRVVVAAAILGGAVFALSLLPIAEWGIFLLQVCVGASVYFLSLLLLRESVVYSYFIKIIGRLKGGRVDRKGNTDGNG